MLAAASVLLPSKHLLWKSSLGKHPGKAVKSTHRTHLSAKRGRRAFCMISSTEVYFSRPKGNQKKTDHVLCTRLSRGGHGGGTKGIGFQGR